MDIIKFTEVAFQNECMTALDAIRIRYSLDIKDEDHPEKTGKIAEDLVSNFINSKCLGCHRKCDFIKELTSKR